MNISLWLCRFCFIWWAEQSITLPVWGTNYHDLTMLEVVWLSNICWYQCRMPTWGGIFWCYDLVADLLFLIVELWLAPACPSPPGLAADSGPSPPGWLLVLHLLELLQLAWPSPPEMILSFRLLHDFSGLWFEWFGGTVEELCVLLMCWGCACRLGLLAPGRADLLHQQLPWVAVVLTTPHPSHGDWAACKQLLCLSPILILILTILSVTLEIPKCWVHNVLYELFKNRYLTWSI
jgi:hypothetical protein